VAEALSFGLCLTPAVLGIAKLLPRRI